MKIDKSQNDKQLDLIDLDSEVKKKKNKSSNREFAVVTYFFLILFVSLLAYFVYFVQFKAEDFINSPYNLRVSRLSDTVRRGDITDKNGNVIATTDISSGSEVRKYNYGSMFAHSIGYVDKGMAGVELDGNFYLLRSHQFVLQRISNELKEEKNTGDTVVTTLDYNVQSAAYNNMKYNGAAIAIEPSTGKIIAMVSRPDYDPSAISSSWESLINDETNSTLINRTIQGLYPPGSTFKTVTALEYIREHDNDVSGFNYNCEGDFTFDDYTIHCSHGAVHGMLDFGGAYANSCNCAFASMGLELNRNGYISTAKELMFNKKIPTKLSNVKRSRFNVDSDTKDTVLMQDAIGQGDTLVTPIHMAMIASAIANDGWVYKPYIMDKVTNCNGITVKKFYKTPYRQIMTDEESELMEEYMRLVVTDGTASSLFNKKGYTCYGKTGTAEYTDDKNKTHSWFVGYARSDEDESKEIAVAVVLEGAGTGSAHAVPLADKMFSAYFAQ